MRKFITLKNGVRLISALVLLCMLLPQLMSCGKLISLLKGEESTEEESISDTQKDTEEKPENNTQSESQEESEEESWVESEELSESETEKESESEEETVVEVPEKFNFKTAAGFVVKGDVMSMNYTSDYQILDLSERLTVKLGTKWCLTNADGTKDKDVQMVKLSNGENRFYVKVTVRNESYIYKMDINYREAYEIEFYTNCNDGIDSQYVDKGDKVIPPVTPVREGYTFDGWYLNGERFNFNTVPEENITLIAHWTKDGAYDAYDRNAPVYEGINAGLHIVWKDYGNPNGTRPESVKCILTQTYGDTTVNYEIVLSKYYVEWADATNTPNDAILEQGEGGAWTLSLKGLPEKVGSKEATYTLTQMPLDGYYTTLQSGTEVINKLTDYVPSVDNTAALTTRNSRLYDAAGNMIVFKGVVTYNIGLEALDKSATPAAFRKLANSGCNAIRVSTQLIGTWYKDPNTGEIVDRGNGYVWRRNESKVDPARTGVYSDAAGDTRVSQEGKDKVLDKIDQIIEMASAEGLYVIINWAVLTSNPYQYVNEASEFFGILAAKHADNPYVLFEICNEPGDCGWETNNTKGEGVKAYAEKVIDVIRNMGSDAIVVVAPRGSAYYLAQEAGDDPIKSPLDDDRRYNVAYTFHNYPYVNSYGNSSIDYSESTTGFGWRIAEAYQAGLTIIVTEMSPMNAKFATSTTRDPIGYDMEHMALFLRQFQELDISFFYFRYGHSDSYNEWLMFKPNVSAELGMWDRDDLTECGKWYYDLITGDGVFITDVDYTVDYNAKRIRIESTKAEYTEYQTKYGLGGIEKLYSIFPTFALYGIADGSAYYFAVSENDILTDIQFKTYCGIVLEGLKNKSPKDMEGETYSTTDLPKKKDTPMELTYLHGGETYTLKISYGYNESDNSWGVTLDIK